MLKVKSRWSPYLQRPFGIRLERQKVGFFEQILFVAMVKWKQCSKLFRRAQLTLKKALLIAK